VRQWFEGAGYSVTNTAAYQAAVATADSQQGFSFQQEHAFILTLAEELGVAVQWLGDGYVCDFPTLHQALMDGWMIIVGVELAVLHPGFTYYHFEDVYMDHGQLRSADPFHVIDGDNGHPDWDTLVNAIQENWDPHLIGLAFTIAA
jgi:hypothetical protein